MVLDTPISANVTVRPAPSHFFALAVKVYALLIAAGRVASHAFLLAIRVVWGWQFFIAGKGKLGNLDGTADFFRDLHIPLPKVNAIMASSTETFGGLLLLVGLGGRLVSVPLSVTMLVAYLTADRAGFNSVDDFVGRAPFPFLFTALVVLCFGPGVFSLDAIIGAVLRKRRPALFERSKGQ